MARMTEHTYQPAYRYLLCDLLTDQLLAVLPLTGVKFGRRISRRGSLKGKLQVASPQQADRARMLHAYAGRSALYVLRDGQLWWGGIPWTVRARQSERGPVELDVQGATFDSYPHHRVLRDDITYTQVDQGVIVPDLWRRLQSDPRGDIGVVAEDQPTGTLRDRTYEGSELHYYGELIEDLGDVNGGPEHTVDVYLDGAGQRTKRLRVANRLGDTKATAVFQRARRGGGRVLAWEDAADAVDGGTTFQTRGESPDGNVGADKGPLLSAVHERTDLLDAGWPLLDVTRDHPTVSVQQTLEDHAAAYADRLGGALPTQGYRVQVGTTGWNPNRLGDTVRLKLTDAWHEGVDYSVRPVGCEVTAAEAGVAESVRLLFGGVDE